MIFRMRYEKRGGHYHCRLFAAKQPHMTYAKCGDLCFAESDWADLQLAMAGVEFLEEEKMPNTANFERKR